MSVEEVTLSLAGLDVNQKVQEVKVKDLKVVINDGDISICGGSNDDGYISSNSSENLSVKGDDDKEEEDFDDEKILEPLVIVDDEQTKPGVELVSRGPVYLDHQTNRFQPYGRTEQTAAAVEAAKDSEETLPNVLIYTKDNQHTPTKIEVRIEWSDRHELCIEKFKIPENAVFSKAGQSHLQLFVQLNPSSKELKSFMADVKSLIVEDGTFQAFIGPIVISLKTDLMDSQEKLLLAEISEEERAAATKLVNEKDISKLVSGMGPHNDTVLAILCAQKKSASPGQTLAQIHAVVQRLLRNREETVRHAVFKLNNNGISAFEIAAITNNSLAACYLAEVMYNLVEDTRSALKILNEKDSQGNTIIHLLARKGDSNAMTLRKLLSMRLTDNTRVFQLGFNAKKQLPMHIVAQSKSNQPETMAILFQALDKSFMYQDLDGMNCLHYAAQRTNDAALVQTILSYKKDNINQVRKDGLSALDLVLKRPTCSAEEPGSFPIDPVTKAEIVTLLKNNGGKSSLTGPEQQQPASPVSPFSKGTTPPSTPCSPAASISALGSPYDSSSINSASPQTLPDECSGGYYGVLRAPGSVESYVQSSPESDHGDQGAGYHQKSYSFIPGMMNPSMGSPYYQTPEPVAAPAPVQQHNTSLEDHLASQFIQEFPEIRNVLGQILDGQL